MNLHPSVFRGAFRSKHAFGILVMALCMVDVPNAASQTSIDFADSGLHSGLLAQHFDGGGTRNYLPQLIVAGLAILDFDNDGWLDVYLLNGRELFSDQKGEPITPLGNTLYHNNRDGTFTDVTQSAGVASYSFGLGVAAADFDNDGDQDLAVSNFGYTQFFANNGDGTFTSIENEAGTAGSANQFGAGIAFLDIDNDGFLDLFASNYVEFSLVKYTADLQRLSLYPPGPNDFRPTSDRLYRSLGNGKFEDVSVPSGIAGAPGPSMGVVCGDFDGDHDSDIFVCSDASANQFFINNGFGKFTDVALEAGVAYDSKGTANGNMGVEAGDYDNDGWVDLLITNYTGQVPMLYRNLKIGLFQDSSRVSQVGRTALPHTNWGVGLFDVDNDGDLDAFFANGHFLKQIQTIDDRTNYRVANTLMRNDGRAGFRDISSEAGAGFRIKESSRGAAFGDMDQDGDIDCIVLNANTVPSYLENLTKGLGAWVDLRLIGTKVNRDAVGAVVRVTMKNKTQVAMVHAGRGYQSHYGTVLHFGLGSSKSIDRISVDWPGGAAEVFDCHEINRQWRLVEGTGKPAITR